MLHHLFTLASTASTSTYRHDLRGTAHKKKAASPPLYTNASKDSSLDRLDRGGLHVNRIILLSRGKIHSPRLGQITYIDANDSHHAEAIGVTLSRIGVGIRRDYAGSRLRVGSEPAGRCVYFLLAVQRERFAVLMGRDTD